MNFLLIFKRQLIIPSQISWFLKTNRRKKVQRDKISTRMENNFSNTEFSVIVSSWMLLSEQELKDAAHKWLILCPLVRAFSLLSFPFNVQEPLIVHFRVRRQSPSFLNYVQSRCQSLPFSSFSPDLFFSGIEPPLIRARTRIICVIDLSIWTLTIIVNRVQILVSLASLILSVNGRCPLMYHRCIFVIGHPRYRQYCHHSTKFIFVATLHLILENRYLINFSYSDYGHFFFIKICWSV